MLGTSNQIILAILAILWLQEGDLDSLFCGNPEGAVDGDASTAPHGDSIQQRNVWLWHRCYQIVQEVFCPEEPALSSTPKPHHHVPALIAPSHHDALHAGRLGGPATIMQNVF